jgi:hypothetical protein
MHRAWTVFSQVKTSLKGWAGNGLPSISPMCTQDRHRFTQVIHTLMHSKTYKKFPAREARPVDGVADRYLMLTYRHAATDTITIGLVPARPLLQ